jgi:hypothetical protein
MARIREINIAMACTPTLITRQAMRRITKALKDFAAKKGWEPEDCQILFRNLEEWGRISVFFIVESFSGLSHKDMWAQVFDYLEQSLNQSGAFGFSVGITVRERQQVEQGGMYSIPDGFMDEEDLFHPIEAD